MDRSSEARTLRQVNGRTRLTVDLSEPLGLIESLTTRLELTDADLGALQGDVTTISNILAAGVGFDSLIHRPEWTEQFTWSNIGPFMDPPEANNFDTVVRNSATPIADYAFNLGQKLLCWRNIWTGNALCEAIAFHFDDNLSDTVFTISYIELRDKLEGRRFRRVARRRRHSLE
jgi:hypothetical protein